MSNGIDVNMVHLRNDIYKVFGGKRKNLINMASMFGHKINPSSPAYVDITVTQNVDATSEDIDMTVY